MRDMRKYHQGVTIWGGNAANATKAARVGLPQYRTTLVPRHVCDLGMHGAISAKAAAILVAQSFTLFPSTKDVMRRIDDDGIAADWARVGRDLHKAMGSVWAAHDQTEAEREAG